MKQLFTYLACLLLSIAVRAGDGPIPAPTATSVVHAAKITNAGAVRFQFRHINAADEHKDSVLIIFDRFDRTGAGVIFQVFAADSANSITIPAVPAGKYYVTIQCL